MYTKFDEMEEFIKAEAINLNLKILKFSVWNTKNNNFNLDILVEKADLTPTSLEDCNKINSLARLWLKNMNLLQKTNLSVALPGIDRQLFSIEDFVRFQEEKIQIELKEPVDNQKRFKGFIKSVECDLITIESDSNVLKFEFNLIDKANIIPNWNKIMKKVKIKDR